MRITGAFDVNGAPAMRASAQEGSPSLTPSSTPSAVPDYELLRRIGGGSYGEVWLGWSLVTGVLRAVKFVRRATFTEERPFQREFEGIKKFEEIRSAAKPQPPERGVYAASTLGIPQPARREEGLEELKRWSGVNAALRWYRKNCRGFGRFRKILIDYKSALR